MFPSLKRNTKVWASNPYPIDFENAAPFGAAFFCWGMGVIFYWFKVDFADEVAVRLVRLDDGEQHYTNIELIVSNCGS